MKEINWASIQAYRNITFRFLPQLRIATESQAVSFVRERGFIFFWPIRGVIFPSLWTAVAGDRPVADAHDDPGHVTWGWKDHLLGGRSWYYAKVLRKKATMISMELAPFFYALSENYGSPEEDYLIQYEQGRMTKEMRMIYEAILTHGVLDTPALRRATHLSSQESESRFNRALADLQADFKIVPVGVTQSGAWHYAFAYNIVAYHYPELPELACKISEDQAYRELAQVYFRSLAAAPIRDFQKIFGWANPRIDATLNQLVDAGQLVRNLRYDKNPEEWCALKELDLRLQ